MSVERIARSLREIDKGTEHRAMCPGCADCEPRTAGGIAFCDCGRADRAAARQAAAVLEALELGIANAGGVSIVTGREVALRALERLAGSPKAPRPCVWGRCNGHYVNDCCTRCGQPNPYVAGSPRDKEETPNA